MENIGRYKVVKTLGEGAMGTVYLADDPHIERQVAIKIIRADGPGYAPEHRGEIEARFLKEAKIVGRLTHTNIVSIFDVGTEKGLPWIAMEFVDGVSLSEKMKREGAAFPLYEKVRITRDVAIALGHAHAKGIVHRDVKPGNIMVSRDGTVKVADFGIGKVLGESTEMTRTGMMVGSPSYMSPEQVKGEKVDLRSDVFSLGVVFFELVTGARPFPADTITTLVYQILNVEPPEPSTIRADLPPAIGAVVRRALAKNPADRYPSCDEFARDLTGLLDAFLKEGEVPTVVGAMAAIPVMSQSSTRLLASSGPGAPVVSAAAPAPRPAESPRSSNSKSIVALLVLALLALGVGGGWVLMHRGAGTETPSVTPPATGVAASAPAPVPPPPPAAGAAPASGAPAATAQNPTVVVTSAAPSAAPAPRVAPAPAKTVAAAAPPPSNTVVHEEPPPSSGFRGTPDGTFVSRRRFKINVDPDQTRLYLDGQYIGVSDDWDGHGGGLYLEPGPGKHHLRAALAGYQEKNFILEVGAQGEDDESQVEPKLEKSGSGEKFEKKGHPEGSTRGAVLLEVAPGDVAVAVDGKPAGSVADYSGKPLLLRGGPRVAEILLTPPSGKSKLLRVVVASYGDETIKIKEKF